MSDYPSRRDAIDQILDIGERMERKNYVVANDGNLSVRTGPDEVVATPTGVSKGRMTAQMMSVLSLDGNVLEQGTKNVSSEVKMHLRVYQENHKVRGVVHAHPITATSFAAAGIPLDESILTEAVTAVGSIPVAHFALPGTQEVPDSIAPFCQEYNAVMLANHGVLSWGPDLETAFWRLEWTEVIAKATLITKYVIGKYNRLSQEQAQAFMPLRERLGIRAGGEPIWTPSATNDVDVLPRHGEVQPDEGEIASVTENIVRRVTLQVLEELERQRDKA